MSNNIGLQITSTVSIPNAQETDFVFNTKKLGGMHILAIKKFKYSDATVDESKFNPYTIYYHELGFTPAILAFGNFGILFGCQNFATPVDTAYADSQKIFVSFGSTIDISVIIFAEKIDS